MNSIKKYFLSLPALAVGMISCTQIESVPVMAPTIQPDEKVQETYKNNIFSRPIAIGMLYDWETVNGISLYGTPDSLDVIVIKGNNSEITSAMAEDMKLTQEVKMTKVLLGVDLNVLDEAKASEVKNEFKKQRLELQASWTEENMPSAEDKERLIAELEDQINEEAQSAAAKMANEAVTNALARMAKFQFDGIDLQLPQQFAFLSKDAVRTILQVVTASAGHDKKYLLSIESPFVEGREEIEKATWVIYNRNVIDRTLEQMTEESSLWSQCRFIASADFKDANNGKGFPDSQMFNPTGKTSRTEDIIYWNAPNKAGVAYYHIESDSKYNEVIKMNYLDLRNLINKLSLTK